MSRDTYDLVVVGGGIHGVGVAQAAAAAGHTVLLLERKAIAHGTSSRSSKLVHGGLRYLETAQLGLVREALREREILRRIAPDLVRLVPFLLPVYAETTRGPLQIRFGLSLYALLGGCGRAMRFKSLRRSEWDDLDGLRRDGLRAVFRYWDAQTDDAALTRAVAASARALGAEIACPAEFVSAARTEVGYRVVCRDREVDARALVNAAGPWVNHVLGRAGAAPLPVELVQGTHVVFDGMPKKGLYYVEAPSDRRAVFVMPWHGRTLVGTTETPFRGDPGAVEPLPEEIAYLETAYAHYFPDRPDEVRDAFAGLRTLPAGPGRPFQRPRELVLHPDADPPRLITLYGGKLSTYRASALRVLRALRAVLPARDPVADTAELPLQGRAHFDLEAGESVEERRRPPGRETA